MEINNNPTNEKETYTLPETIPSCPHCNNTHIRHQKQTHNWKCYNCKNTFTQPHQRPRLKPPTQPWKNQKQHQTSKPQTLQQIQTIAEEIQDPRKRALFILTYLTAGRISEIIQHITKKDITLTQIENTPYLIIDMPNLKNRDKKYKQQLIPIENEQTLINLMSEYINPQPPAQPLFQFGRTRAEQLITQTTGINPHWLRHLRLTHLKEIYKFDAYDLMYYAGWSSITPGKKYIEMRQDTLAQKYKQQTGPNP